MPLNVAHLLEKDSGYLDHKWGVITFLSVQITAFARDCLSFRVWLEVAVWEACPTWEGGLAVLPLSMTHLLAMID